KRCLAALPVSSLPEPTRSHAYGRKAAEQPHRFEPAIFVKAGDNKARFELTSNLCLQRMTELDRLLSLQFALQLRRRQTGEIGVRQRVLNFEFTRLIRLLVIKKEYRRIHEPGQKFAART